jgi:predicted dienelactone hydrolase
MMINRGLVAILAVAVAAVVPGCGNDNVAGDIVNDVVVQDIGASDAAADVPADTVVAPLADYSTFGPYTVGHVHVDLVDTSRARTLPVEIWYPATEAARAAFDAGKPITEMFSEAENALLAPLLADPSPCLTTTVHAVRDAEPSAGPWPLVAFSHCSGCIRTSNVSLIERLASHGFAVVSADHMDNTLWDSLSGGEKAGLSAEFLAVRGADVKFVLDTVLDAGNQAVPEIVRGRFDAGRVAMFGHSFGAMTTGFVTTTDPRIKGAVLHAAPFAYPFDLVRPEDNTKPVYTILAAEDAMIMTVGNNALRSNFAMLGGPAWKVEVQDTGHLSFHDLCHIKDSFFDCCGEGARQSDQSFEPFTYMDQHESMQIAATGTTAFMAWLLLGDRGARGVFETPASEKVSIEIRNPPAGN